MICAKRLEDYVLDVRESNEMSDRDTGRMQIPSTADAAANSRVFGSNTMALRGRMGVSRNQLAECIQRDECEVAALEAGDHDCVDFDTIVRIRACLGVDIDDLLSGIR